MTHRERPLLTRSRLICALAVLIALIFSKYFYLASMWSYYTFFLMGKFGLSLKSAQLHLFSFLFAVAAGTLLGGPVGIWTPRLSSRWRSGADWPALDRKENGAMIASCFLTDSLQRTIRGRGGPRLPNGGCPRQ